MPHDAKCPVAVLFVRDLAVRGAGDARMLRDLFGFTTAEANLALALQRGVSPNDYARAHRISINTVYTHLRRIKEKSACQRLPELICRLAELRGLPITTG
jgi:DNA-binding CsgD family transcriptional regulator